ncbi:hypothetical protein KIJ96_06070 [Pseudoalteromonas piscicida]|uniref:hypothetical protein n=1 Tax=Pseudoalteromonas TaxID=53246 RepID=UPI001D09CA4B|nr:hypothetical protein [Pseudoalteromonas piscicida]UDM62805.1 hypothetical protein KIJ96_06070 [Pseudoalteromonas piscicida]
MKWFLVLLSVSTVVFMLSGLELAGQQSKDKELPDNSTTINFVLPTQVAELEVEQQWLFRDKLPEESAEKNDKEMKPAEVEGGLLIAGESYQFLGIFQKGKNPFVVLKSKDAELFKLEKGDEFKSSKLVDIKGNEITVINSEKEYKFKLFERSNNG